MLYKTDICTSALAGYVGFHNIV